MSAIKVEAFLDAHKGFAAALDDADTVKEPSALVKKLQSIRAAVINHLRAKDAFYPEIAAELSAGGDVGGAQLARVFEQNMKIQSAAVQRFFDTLDTTPPQLVADSYRTVARVLRQRFSTEERAVFPLTTRNKPRGKK